MIETVQELFVGMGFWEVLAIKTSLTVLAAVLGWLGGRVALKAIKTIRWAKKPQDFNKKISSFRWAFLMVGMILMLILSIYLVWGTTPQKLLEQNLFSLSKDKEVRVSNVLGAVLIFILARIGVFSFRKFFVRAGETSRLPLDQGRRLAIFQIGKYILYLVALLLILTSLNINLSVLVASSAALFVGIGLALQNTFSDIAAGIVILVDRTVEVGDMVVIDSLKLEGKVVEIRLRSTVVETQDLMTVIVPNSRFTTTNVVNWSFNDRETRFRVKVGVAYGSNVGQVRKILVQAAKSHGLILKKPEPRVRFTEFGESSLDFELLFWTNRVLEYQDIKSDLRFMIEAEFRKSNISIPFPQRDLHIVSDFRQGKDTKDEEVEPGESKGEEK